MCGRYGRTKSAFAESADSGREQQMLLDFGYKYLTYNAGPKSLQPVITSTRPEELQLFLWGLIPRDSKNEKPDLPYFNTRAESIEKVYPWKNIFPKNRCLIPADFFYEWPKVNGVSLKGDSPFLFKRCDSKTFYFAGIWDAWLNSETRSYIPGFSIITTTPNELVAEIHNRMPVILDPDTSEIWLDQATTRETLLGLLKPFPAEEMESYQVGNRVGNIRNDDENLIDPVNLIF